MEIDIGNLIYILFIAVIFLLNLLTKSRKKQQGRPDSDDPTTLGPPPAKGKTFEELLEEFTGGNTEPAPAPTPAPAPKPKPIAQPTPAVRRYGDAATAAPQPRKEHSIMKTEFGRFDEFENEEQESSDYASAFSNLDDAKRAFIYSEIFKKKY